MAGRKKSVTGKRGGGRKKKPTETAPRIKIETYDRDLDCQLSRSEVEERALTLSKTIAEHDIATEIEKQRSKREKGKLGDMMSEIRRLSNVVRDRTELRPTACERRVDYTKKRVTDVRIDTGAILSERDMTPGENQPHLPFEEEDGMADDTDASESNDTKEAPNTTIDGEFEDDGGSSSVDGMRLLPPAQGSHDNDDGRDDDADSYDYGTGDPE